MNEVEGKQELEKESQKHIEGIISRLDMEIDQDAKGLSSKIMRLDKEEIETGNADAKRKTQRKKRLQKD